MKLAVNIDHIATLRQARAAGSRTVLAAFWRAGGARRCLPLRGDAVTFRKEIYNY
jgi:pyridoxine 5'-phosphate synthase PdxJ